MKAKQAVVVGFVLGIFVSVGVGCGSNTGTGSCSTSNCTGCCTAGGTCVGGTADTECGKGGATCSSCSAGTPFCSAGVCKATSGSGGGSGGTGGGTAGTGGGTSGSGGGSGGVGVGGGSGGVGGGSGGVGGGSGGVGGGSGGVGGGSGAGGGGVVLACGAGVAANHLLLSEVRVQPTNAEAVEIYNPTAGTIDLSDYRLYNATFVSADGLSNCRYYNHAPLIDAGTCGLGGFSDFDLQFPAGSTISAGEAKVIAIGGAATLCGAGFCPTGAPAFEIPPTDGGMNDPNVADMRGVWDVSAQLGFFTNASEDLILYKWNGNAGSNVQDVDYFIWGNTQNIRTDKTGVGTYLPDTAIAAQQSIPSLDAGNSLTSSYQRGCYNENGETKTGGNGITGHNETSEPLNNSWFIGLPSLGTKSPGSVP